MWEVLPVFLSAIFLLAVVPGPDLVLISAYSTTKGFSSGLMISVGILIAGVLQTVMVALGLGSLMQSVPVIAYGLKIVGALYLSYLGICMLLGWYRNNRKELEDKPTTQVTNFGLVRRGLIGNLLNPKALLFFSLFLPQFTSGTENLTIQLLILGSILSVFTFVINVCFSISMSKFGAFAASKVKIGKHAEGILGLVFLGLAARLGTSRLAPTP